MTFGFSIKRRMTEISRLRRIAEVLVRNGLGALAENIGLTRSIPRWRSRQVTEDARAARLTMPERVRRTLEALGPTYIKLGQILSTRPDVLPPDYIVELTKLLDAAPPVPLKQIKEQIERELGAPLEQRYAHFDPEPIAAASIGQVHRAQLADGSQVVVKVRRPGIEGTVEADLSLLVSQARFLEGRSDTLKSYGLGDLVDEFAQALRDELDYINEGRNADRLRELIRDEGVLVPRVYWELTTHRVITLSDLHGLKLSEREALLARGYDLGQIAARVVQVYLKMVFEHGIFHADPHPANILVCDNQIGLVDFGSIGYLTPRMREELGDLLFALVRQDAQEMVHVITRMGATERTLDRKALQRDLRRMLLRYYDASLESVPIAQFLAQVMVIAFRHHVRLPADLTLLARTVMVLEGVVRTLDPSFVLEGYLEPFVVQLVKERVSIKRALVKSVNTLRDLEDVIQVLPRRVDVISGQLERGEMTLGVDIHRLDQGLRKLDAIANRLAFSVIVAAIIIGSALILLGGESAAIFVIPFTDIVLPIPQIGFVMAGLLGAWLLFSIVRSRGL